MGRHRNGNNGTGDLTLAGIHALDERPRLIAALRRQQEKIGVLNDKITLLTELLRLAAEEEEKKE